MSESPDNVYGIELADVLSSRFMVNECRILRLLLLSREDHDHDSK